MARWFNADVSDYLAFDQSGPGSPILGGYPFAMSAWVMNPEWPAGHDFCIMFRSRPAQKTKYFSLGMRTIAPASYPSFIAEASDGVNTFFANSGVQPNDSEWYHVIAEFTSVDARSIYVNGTKYTTARSVAPSFGSLIQVGRLGATVEYLQANVADCCVFDATGFTTADALELAGRRSMLGGIHFERATFFVPFVGDEDRDVTFGHRQVASTGGTPEVAAHPPISYPMHRYSVSKSSAAAKSITLGTLHGMSDLVLAG